MIYVGVIYVDYSLSVVDISSNLSTHTGYKPLTGDACGLQFAGSGCIKCHVRTHSG